MPNLFNYKGFDYLNITATVGADGVNDIDDVYLVQAFLYEVLTYRATNYSVRMPPLPTGTYDCRTTDALADYKKICNQIAVREPRYNHKVYYDKHINPIQGSIFAFGTNKLWAMARLNGEIYEVMTNSNIGGTNLKYMYAKYPKLPFMFR
jgi:hypothetical protein